MGEVTRLSLEEMYAEPALPAEEYEALLDASLRPRGPDLLYEIAGELGLRPASRVLDVGCREGAQLLELHRCYGCAGVGLEPMAANVARAPAALESAPIRLLRGVGEAMPFPDHVFDLVWVRDVLIHVERLTEALAECARVARPGAPILVFQMFATPWLEPAEAYRLWPPLAVVARNTDRAAFERAVADAGLRIERRDELASEWREFLEEGDAAAETARRAGQGRTARQMLWAARLLRRPEHYRAAIGDRDYAVELANCLWGVYQMIGKLSPAIYVLRTASG